MSKKMAKLYEKAWNKTVEELSEWQKNIIINNFPYNDPSDKRVSDEVAHKAALLAEQWEKELKGKTTTSSPS
jgi:hypothetical protein